MNISIKGTNLELTPHITEYIQKKMDDVEKFIPAGDKGSIRLYFEIGKTTTHHQTGEALFRAEVNVHTDIGYFRAAHSAASPDAAIDGAKDEIIREFKANKGKRETLSRKGGALMKRLLRRFYKE